MTANTTNNDNNNYGKDDFKSPPPTIETDSYLYDMGQLSSSFCEHCGVIFYVDVPLDAYKVKGNNLFLCGKCFIEIRTQHLKRNVVLEGTKI